MIAACITEIEELLRRTMGLDPSSLGADGVHRAARQRSELRGFRNLEGYVECVRESAEELQALIEAVVVPETWFFRHIEAFQALTDWVQTQWLSKPQGRDLRILSAPCSTGEEPYSIAMALLDAVFPFGTAPAFSIDAIDISRPALAQAAQGIYRENSFRSAHLSFRDRYFQRDNGAYRIDAEVQKAVQFRLDNLFSPGFNEGRDGYDIIFCRNVLIYFGHDKQQQTVAALTRLLAPSGVLFVGPAEGCLMMEAGFTALPQRMSFGFRRRQEADSMAIPKPSGTSTPRRATSNKLHEVRSKPKVVNKSGTSKRNQNVQEDSPIPDIALARQYADAGRLADAEVICEQLLGKPPASAEVYALLGVVQDALGRDKEAEESYRRAIYLDPAHHQALIHLAAISDARHDSVAAKRLRDRARRSEER